MDNLTTDTEITQAEQTATTRRLYVRKEIVIAYKKIALALEMPLQVLIMRVLMEGLEHFGVFDDPRPPLPAPPPERPLPVLPPLAGNAKRGRKG